MDIIRYKGQESGYTYDFKEDDKTFTISFGGNLDLYWSLKIEKDYKDFVEMQKEIYETFLITKENYQIYDLFKTLLEEIKSSKVYTPNQECVVNEDDEIEYYPPSIEEINRVNERNEKLKEEEGYKRLIKEDSVEWHSDEEEYSIADVVKISEQGEIILLEFYRPALTGEKYGMRFPGTVTIRFRNSGSRFHPYNYVFMRHYNALQEFDPELDKEFHQIHIEELPYQLTRGQK